MALHAQNDDLGLAGFQYALTVWESLENRSRSEIILPNWRRGTTGFYLFSKHCIDTSDAEWQQVQLSLSSEGLGFRSLPHHLSATRIHLLLMLLWLWSAFISSLCSCGFGLHSSPPYAPVALVCIHLLLMLLWLWSAFISSLCSCGFGLHSSPPYAPVALVCIHLLLMLLWLWSTFISSLCSSGFGLHSSHHLSQAIEIFNTLSLSLYQSLRNPFLVS